MDMPETIEALQYLKDLMWQHNIVPPYPEQSKFTFATGKSAMTMEGTGYLSRFMEQIGDKYEFDVARRPMGKVSRGYYLASDMFGITSSSTHKDQAWRFLRYLTSKDGAEAYARIMSRGPIRRSAFPAYQKAYSDYNISVYVEGMTNAVISPETQIYKIKEARDGLIWKAVRDQIETNKKDVKQAIGEISDAVRALYK
jgi:multiple sugar transport system substrate-binding protein